jgi:GrpB-like predicted nucleotidyltransferase (UPF0157 family)
MESLEKRIQRVLREEIAIVPHDSRWPGLFGRERDHLWVCLPGDLLGRVEHLYSSPSSGLGTRAM